MDALMEKNKSAKGAARRQQQILNAKPRAIALAALYISESVLLELQASEILSSKDIRGLLRDAATTLRGAGAQGKKKTCRAASEIVDSISRLYEGRAQL
jgi:hypothetical protein